MRVYFKIEKNAQRFIKKDSKITIASDGLMGNKVAIIIPGIITHKEIENNDFVSITISVSVDDILIEFNATTTNAAIILEDLLVIMNNMRLEKGQ